MYFDKKNINALTYFGVFTVLIVVLFFSYKTYINYQSSHTLYNSMTDNMNETLLINDWTHGHLATITPTTIMPQSMIPTEYSISFLIYLNNIDDTDPNKEQIIFIKGQKNNSELTLSIKPLRYNPHSDLRFTSKLQVDVECNSLDNLLNNVCTGAGDNFVDTANINTNGSGGEQFSNTSFNSNRVHDKIGSNVVDYFTVQNIYSKETFTSISKETFDGGDGDAKDDDEAKEKKIKEKKIKIEEDILEIEKLLTRIDKIVEGGELTQFKEEATKEKEKVITRDALQKIVNENENADLDELIKQLTKAQGIADTAIKSIRNILTDMSGPTKNEDYVELSNTSTQKISHICLVMRENIIDVYKNGSLESSKVLDSIPVINDGKFTFFPDLNKGFNGSINKFTYFNKALNHNEVTENYDKMIKIIENTTRSELQN